METVIFKSQSKKDINLLVNIAKKIGVEVKRVSSKKDFIEDDDPAYELKVERNLGLLINEGLESGVASKEEVMKAMNKWK